MKLRSRWQLAILAAAAFQAPVLAQTTRPAKFGPLGELSAARALFREHASNLETEITECAVTRADATGLAKPRLELELDLRLLGAWLASAQGDDEVMANAYLRLRQLAAATEALETELTDAKLSSLTAAQKEGLKRLHDLTYRLPEAGSVANIDTVCRDLAWGILQASNPQAVTEKSLPVMRPMVVPPAPNLAPPEPQKAAKVEARDPEKLLPQLNVSPRLRQQLLQTQTAMRAAESTRAADADALRKMLYDAIDLAAGFSANAAVESEERLGLEQQLTEALALFVDPRTRSIARGRIDALGQYRGLVQTISDLNLSPQSFRLLSPAFRYVQQHPSKSAEILVSVRQFVDMAVKYEALTAEVPAAQGLTKLPSLYQEARKAFENHRNLYLGALEQLEATDLMASGPDALPPALAEMRQSYETVSALAVMGPAVETLNAFKPKPVSGLEKRILQEASLATAAGQGEAKLNASKLLASTVQLAEAARELPKLDFSGLPVEALATQGIERVSDLEKKARDTLASLASALASGGPLDPEKLKRHRELPKLLASLKAAGATQGAFANVDLLARWSDWDGDRETLSLVMSPYLSALNSAVAGYLAGTGEAIGELPQVEYATYPLRTLLVRDLMTGPELAKLPEGLPGLCGKLATPSDLFGAERYTSFGMVVWSRARAAGDLKASETALKLVCKRIATDLALRFDERRATFTLPSGGEPGPSKSEAPRRPATRRRSPSPVRR